MISYTKIFYLLHGMATNKDLSCVKINNINPLCLITDKLNGYIEESNDNKCLTLVVTDESKGTEKIEM